MTPEQQLKRAADLAREMGKLRDELMCRLYLDGWTARELAELVGKEPHSVRAYLSRNGVTRHRRTYRKGGQDPIDFLLERARDAV